MRALVTAEREALAARVRDALPSGRSVREVSMFGGLSFMVDDSMVVAVRRGGELLVRVDPARNEELLDVPGAAPAVMGDQDMGPSWITVSADGIATGEQLGFWVRTGLEGRGRGISE
ncbi:MAG: TfoX/Sxy family protein [Propionibacteriaceae bacterium]